METGNPLPEREEVEGSTPNLKLETWNLKL